MAENWVLKGSLKGPQGDPGEDAQLPSGGTEGQVLTKTSGGEAWQDAPEPDMTGMATFKSVMGTDVLAKVGEGGQEEFVNQLLVVPSDYDLSSGEPPTSLVAIWLNEGQSVLSILGNSTTLNFGSKKITAITDDVSDGSSSSLATAKAVKDYVDGVDALPSGGSTRDVLAKTASGEGWSNGYPWVSNMDGGDWTLRGYFSGAERNVPHLTVKSNSSGSSEIDLDATLQKLSVSGSSPKVDVRSVLGEYVTISATSDDTAEIATNGQLTIDDKSVSSITDDATSGSATALVTAKAVTDYVKMADPNELVEYVKQYMGGA